ncbi:Phosphatidylinositol 3-kinase catalytic subunit type 3 [Aphelenchoides bicaudatus]|nr:Phosphatidylinositol 3-kinase catalytic subunit type 3 [Aphelenchoides bicaudatus]
MKTEFHYLCASEIQVPVSFRIVSLYGYDRTGSFSGEMYIKVALYCNRRKVGTDICTRYKPPRYHSMSHSLNNRDIQTWDEWIQLPITYAELNSDALIHVTLWDVGQDSQPVFSAQCSKYLFSKHLIMRSGQFDLRLQRPKSPDELPKPVFSDPSEQSKMPRSASIHTLLKKEKLFKDKYIDVVPWLDQITFIKLETLKQAARTEDRSLYLTLEMRPITSLMEPVNEQYKILYYMPDIYPVEMPINPERVNSKSYSFDPEMGMENLCEIKHHMLTRNVRSNDIDRRLQPNSLFKDMLEAIIRMPTSQPMSMEERDMIWKFRFWLKNNPHALTKFVRSVNWDERLEVKQAIQVLREWEPIDACDALELLGPTFTHPFVRRYAVWRLQTTKTSTLLSYLPQLVQSLRYEAQIAENAHLQDIDDEYEENAPLLIDDTSAVPTCSRFSTEPTMNAMIEEFFGCNVDMSTFLVDTACRDSKVANFLFWYLKVEVEANSTSDPRMSKFYSAMIEKMKLALTQGAPPHTTLYTINTQCKFVENLVKISRQITEGGGNRAKKLENLKRKLADSSDMMDLKGLALPLDPTIHVKNIQPESTVLFSSKLMPMRLTFSTVCGGRQPYEYGEPYMTIFKRGDDLRQDQLVLQMIRLMDNLLKDEKLDLRLTPYSVLSTSVSDGFVQYVKATPIADLKGGILEHLKMYRPSSSGPYGIEADVIENYVRSCAGYSMICYVLGIGDRHMHNLLLCENGKMFHVDFGYILGRDPKPMPPPMKLTTEMINGMGGQNSEHFKKFIDYCTTGFLIIRRHANLIINLFSLMLDAGIPDIAIEKDKAVQTILERFHLHLSDEDACKEINRAIQLSISAKMPLIVDFVHDVRQFIS